MRSRTGYVHHPRPIDDAHAPTSVPIYQTATFGQSSADAFDEFDYSRSGNPTRRVLEAQLARIEHADHAFAFASGMAAISALLRLVVAGEEVLVGDDIYGGTFRLLHRIAPGLGLTARAVDTTDPEAVRRAITPRTRLLLLESPSNPTMRISDIRALSNICGPRGVRLAVDNTMLSPYLQNPLDHGADLVIHSATKHLGGHGDVTAGCLAVSDAELADRIGFVQNAEGAALGPMDSWLLLRGLTTLPLRMAAQQRSARAIVHWLRRRPDIAFVHYPQPAPDSLQARGGGSVISFCTGDETSAERLVQRTRLFRTTVSFGCVSSSISLPCRMSHACVTTSSLRTRPVPDDLVRISIGIEAPADLIDDLRQATDGAVQAPADGIPSPLHQE